MYINTTESDSVRILYIENHHKTEVSEGKIEMLNSTKLNSAFGEASLHDKREAIEGKIEILHLMRHLTVKVLTAKHLCTNCEIA